VYDPPVRGGEHSSRVTRIRCAVCKAEVYRNNVTGKVLMHTVSVTSGLKSVPVICQGSDYRARP